jgi:hypothetical protein
MRRREFLIASSMGGALLIASRAGAGIAGSGGPSPTAEVPPSAFHAVVYEPRYPVACEFAQRQIERGARAFGTNECMVRLWRGPLTEPLARGDTRIAGLTLYSDFAIARDCARDRGLRVLQEGWCRDCSVTLVSWLIGT